MKLILISPQRQIKILIIEDSHAREIASEIQLKLGDDFEIQGIVKPGSDLAAITHAVNRDLCASILDLIMLIEP